MLKFFIDKKNGSYSFKIQTPDLEKDPYIRSNIINSRQKILNKVNKVMDFIYNQDSTDEDLHKSLLNVGNSIQELIGTEYINEIKKYLADFNVVLISTNDPIIPWELLIIDDKPLCLYNSLGRVVSKKLQDKFEKDEEVIIRILFICNPLGDLPNTKIEIQNILDELKPAIDKGYFDTMVLEGANATTTNIIEIMKSRKIDIIHYSGHAFFDEDHPEKSGLILSDKVLNATEISRSLEYFPELVFVNACESAKSDSGESQDDVPGIGQAFINAGTKTFIGSLWPIDDREASYFAVNFYHNLLQNRSAGECVLVSRKFLYDNPDSIYGWASFMMYGNPTYVPSSFDIEFLNSIERITLPQLEEPIKLRVRQDMNLLKPIKLDPDRKIIPMGVEDEFLDYLEKEEFNIILGSSGSGKTNCKYLLSENRRDIHFVEIDKNYLKGIKNSEALLKIRSELELLADTHKYVVMVFDEEHYSSDMNEINLIEIIGLLFESGKPTKIRPNLRLLIFLRPNSYKNILNKGKIPFHWKTNIFWLLGIKLTGISMEQLLSLHDLSKDNFSKPAYNLLQQKTSSREWIYPIFADKLLLYLQNLYSQLEEGEQISTKHIEAIHISDEIVETMRFLVYKIRPDNYQKVWNIIANLNKFFKVNPPLWLIKDTIKKLGFNIPDIIEIIQELKNDNILTSIEDEIQKQENYLFAHDIFYEVPLEKYDNELLKLHGDIENSLKKNLAFVKDIKNPRKLEAYLTNIKDQFYFLSINPYGTPSNYIDLVLDFFRKLDVKILTSSIIPYLELLVYDFYSRAMDFPESDHLESISKLYFFIGDYYLNPQINDFHPATDFYNIGCHILESKNKDSTKYRIKNGKVYDRFIHELDMMKIENQIIVELAAWQWKASKQYEKGIQIRKILANTFLKINKPWAAADFQWCAEVAVLNDNKEEAIEYYNKAIDLLQSEPRHVFNVLAHLNQLSTIYSELNRLDEKNKIDVRISELENNIIPVNKPNGKKIFILSGEGDLFVANQIRYKILQEINAEISIKNTIPNENPDILIMFGGPLTPHGVGDLLFKYLDRETINKMLSSSGYWIKKPTYEGAPIIIAIGGYTMFDTRRESENLYQNESFKEIIKLL